MVDDSKYQNNNQTNGFSSDSKKYKNINMKKIFPRRIASRGHPFYIKPKELF